MADDIQTLKEQEKEEEPNLQKNGHKPLVTPPAAAPVGRARRKSGSLFGPLLLIVLGGLFLGRNLGLFNIDLNWQALFAWWPLILVFAGLNLIAQQVKRPFGTLLSGVVALAALAVFGTILLFGSLPFLGGIENSWFPTGEVSTTRVDVDGSGLEAAEIEIEFTNAGGTLSGLEDSNNLISGEVFHIGDFVIAEDRESDRTNISLYEDGTGWMAFSPDLERWDLQLNSGIPLDLDLELSNGSTTLQLDELTLTNLRIDSSNGSTSVALPAGEYATTFNAGNGAVVISFAEEGQIDMNYDGANGATRFEIPDELEVRIVIEDSGNGSFSAPERFDLVSGDRRGEGVWETEDYADSADNRLEIVIDQGNGSIRIQDQ